MKICKIRVHFTRNNIIKNTLTNKEGNETVEKMIGEVVEEKFNKQKMNTVIKSNKSGNNRNEKRLDRSKLREKSLGI